MRRAFYDFVKLCSDHRIAMAPPGHRHNRRGWVQICCPLCRENDYHLGYKLADGYLNCYKCGGHLLGDVVAARLGLSLAQALVLIKKYEVPRPVASLLQKDAVDRPTKVGLPKGTRSLAECHKRYLRSRGFDPDEIAALWDIQGTLHEAPNGWRYRIIIPVYQEGVLVAYQGRSVVEGDPVPYRSIPDAEAAVPISECLYGIDQVLGDRIAVVEGVTDVWRFGPGAVARFGAGVSQRQIGRLRLFGERWIVADNDEHLKEGKRAGQLGARRVISALSGFRGEDWLVELQAGVKDVGAMSPEMALDLRRTCGF